MLLDELKNNLVKYSKILVDKGLVVSSGGNVSFCKNNKMYVTPTGVVLDEIKAHNLACVDLDGNRLNEFKPSKESVMHSSIYKSKDVDVIIHAHPYYTTILASHKNIKKGKDIPLYTPGYAVKVGEVGLVDYYPPGSRELSQAVTEEISNKNAVLMKKHGVIVSADDFRTALNLIEDIELNSRMYVEYNNDIEPLTEKELNELLNSGY